MGMKTFYEKALILDKLKKMEKPNDGDLEVVLKLVTSDDETAQYLYDKNEQGSLNPGWIELLDRAGEFECLNAEEAGIIEKVKAIYLVDCASSKAESVLAIIRKLKAKDPWIESQIVNAVLKMNPDIAAQAISIVLDYIGEREPKIWFFIGEAAAKLMVRLAETHPTETFKVGRALLDVWRPGEKEAGIFETIRSRFGAHEYKELMFDYFSKVWEKQPYEATCVLVDIYDKYLEEYNNEKGYDTSEYLGVNIEDLENIERLEYDIDSVVMEGICEAGRAVIEKEPQKVSRLLIDLEKRNKGIFHRTEMYLLRFVPVSTEKDRINRIVGNQKFIENSLYRYEHRRLLNDKFDETEEEVKKIFIEWIKKIELTEERKKEVTEWCQKNNQQLPDFEKWNYQIKGENLYLVRDRFKELYEEYKAKAGLNDMALAPKQAVSEFHTVSPMEGTPLELDKMTKMSTAEVLDYVLNPKNYEGEKKPGQWGTPADALRATFKSDVNKRSLEYLECDSEKLQKLHPDFLGALFYGIQDAIRAGSFSKSSWPKLISLAHKIVQQNFDKENYRNCFSPLLSAMRDGFTQEDRKIDFDEKIIELFWDILEALVRYEEHYQASRDERDPMQMRCISVNGEALEQVVMLGISCKQEFPEYYEEHLKAKIREVLNYVTTEVKRPEVNCTLGIDLGRIGWLDEEWLKGNIEKIFEGEMWDVVWGTHVSWGRPYRPGFNLLLQRGIYENAISKLGTPNKFKFGKDPEEGFAEHMMIALFNGWIDVDDELLKNLFNKASQKLRGYAARFLTTGFKPEKESGEDYQEVSERLKAHWKKRLDAMKKEPSANIEEAIGFTGWVKDSLLEPKETLELLEETLQLSGGRLGKLRDTRDFVEGVCKLSKGNELAALRCLKKAAAEEEMRMPWAAYQDPLIGFLQSIADLPDHYDDIEDIRTEAIAVADAYGRLHPEKFREVWVRLTEKGKKNGDEK